MPNHCAHVWLYYRHAAFLSLVRGGREDRYLMEIIHYGRLNHRDYAAYRDLIRPVFIFFWDKASYYWGISQ